MQVSDYFKKSYELGSTNKAVKSYDKGVFIGIQQYYSSYFVAMTYLILGKEGFKMVAEAGEGIAKALGNLNAAC